MNKQTKIVSYAQTLYNILKEIKNKKAQMVSAQGGLCERK